ncbi:MAG: hypothetical protein QOD29_3035 [Alphaproteobacteria bacterium]|nr:hypothetical protein [Alphaproteobacteria bacterium]
MAGKILLVFVLACVTAMTASAQHNTDVPLGPVILPSDKIASPPPKGGIDSGGKGVADSKQGGDSKGAPSDGATGGSNKPTGPTPGNMPGK